MSVSCAAEVIPTTTWAFARLALAAQPGRLGWGRPPLGKAWREPHRRQKRHPSPRARATVHSLSEAPWRAFDVTGHDPRFSPVNFTVYPRFLMLTNTVRRGPKMGSKFMSPYFRPATPAAARGDWPDSSLSARIRSLVSTMPCACRSR